MASKTTITCDRCGDELTGFADSYKVRFNLYAHRDNPFRIMDLCDKCKDAVIKLIENPA